MPDDTTLTRRKSLKAILATGVILGGAGTTLAASADGDRNPLSSALNGNERTLYWEGQGDEHATQDCEEEEDGYWKWILTRGGRTAIEEGAELTVKFDDNTETTVTGYFPGAGAGAVHFDVFKAGGGTVDSASVTFSGGGANALLTISDGDCVDRERPPNDEPVLDYWQLDFGEGVNPPIPPRYYPDDGMFALGSEEDGVLQNPSHNRQQITGQLEDVVVVDNQFQFDDEDNPESVTVEFRIDDEGETRDLHLALFELPGPFDEDEIDQQVLVDVVSDEFEGGETGELTLDL